MKRKPDRKFEQETGSLEERLSDALERVIMAGRASFMKEAMSAGISAVQFQIIRVLGREGKTAVGDLARKVNLTPATVSDSVNALVEKGFARKEKDADDRRRVVISLTEKGMKSVEAPQIERVFSEILGGMEAAEKLVLFRFLLKLILSFQERGIVQEARMCLTCRYFQPHVHDDRERPHHCALVDAPLGGLLLRVDCPDHEAEKDPSNALKEVDRFVS